jgi:ABC-type multidrug transport system fused ATPase/permease subunit
MENHGETVKTRKPVSLFGVLAVMLKVLAVAGTFLYIWRLITRLDAQDELRSTSSSLLGLAGATLVIGGLILLWVFYKDRVDAERQTSGELKSAGKYLLAAAVGFTVSYFLAQFLLLSYFNDDSLSHGIWSLVTAISLMVAGVALGAGFLNFITALTKI